MINRLKQYLANRKEERTHKLQEWRVQVNHEYWLSHPQRYREMEQWHNWGEMQTDVLSQISAFFPQSYIYFLFQTIFPDDYKDLLEKCEHVIVSEDKKEGQVSIFRHPADPDICTEIFSSLGVPNFARCVYILDFEPIDWPEEILHLYKITRQIADQQASIDDYNELSHCHCLCYSLDEDLIIAKVNMEKEIIIDILHDVAFKNDLKLILQNDSLY